MGKLKVYELHTTGSKQSAKRKSFAERLFIWTIQFICVLLLMSMAGALFAAAVGIIRWGFGL